MKFEIAPTSTEMQANWEDARLYCFALNVDGKTGWRLPTKEELIEIYQSENDFCDGSYWSSTVGLIAYERYWVQHFDNGQLNVGKKSYCHYIRAVRDLKDD